MAQLLTGKCIVGGAPTPEQEGAFHAVNPSNGELLEPAFYPATLEQIDKAVRAASDSSAEYASLSREQRAAFLQACADELEALGSPLVRRTMLETALPEPRLRAELGRTANQLRLFANVVAEGSWVDARIDHANPDREPLPKPDVRSMLIPLGPVAVFGASNFPLAFSVAGGDTASALAAGCPVIVKAHPAHPGTSEIAGTAITRAAQRTGMPAGVFSLLFDSGIDVGVHLVQHPLIKAVGFTGSRTGGLALLKIAQAREEPIPVYAEMSSINPVVFTGAALSGRASPLAAALTTSITGSAGQLCTQPGLLFIPQGAAGDEFISEVVTRLAAVPACALLTHGIHDAYRRGVEALQNHPAVTPLAGPGSSEYAAGSGLFSTTLDALRSDATLTQEVFGPSSLVVRYRDISDVALTLRELEGQLTLTLQAQPEELPELRGLLSAMRAKSGRVILNGFPTGVEVGHAMVHGGPFPATSDGRSTSVGTRAVQRFARPFAYQDFPEQALPLELRESNPLGLWRLLDGQLAQH